jgi:hypothetical protein
MSEESLLAERQARERNCPFQNGQRVQQLSAVCYCYDICDAALANLKFRGLCPVPFPANQMSKLTLMRKVSLNVNRSM